MTAVVIDASIAIKWVIEEEGTGQSLALREHTKVMAPELLVAECANILWRKTRLNELSADEARMAARLLQAAPIELVSTRSLLEAATRIAIEIDHPAYDCLYLALAIARSCQFVTADDRFLRKIEGGRGSRHRGMAISLAEATRHL